MIIVLKQDAPDAQVREFCHELQDMGLQINDSKGSDTHILALSDDTLAGKLEAERVSMAQQIAAKEEKLQNELKEL